MQNRIRFLTHAAISAALYVVLNLLQNLLLPGTTSMPIQFRAAEALCVIALFTPAAVPGLTVGCMIYNLINAGALPLDFLLGSAATCLSALTAYSFRRVRLGKLPLLSLLMPVVFNALLVGWELYFYLGQLPLWQNMLYVAIGEAAVMLTLGTALYYAMTVRHLDRRLEG